MGANFRFNQRLVTQYYMPQLEKFRFRGVYSGKLSYRHRKAPLQLTPYVQYFLYYYAGGKEFELEPEEDVILGEEEEGLFTDPPNGFHRYRLRAGFRIKPIPQYKPLSLVFYYAMQREFNLPFGNDLNIEVEHQQRPILPFNNFNIIGVQANFIFN
jgi:hypothetical protein